MLEGSTSSKTTLRTSLVLIWFEDSPHSNQSFGKTIGPTTGHEDQLIKISSFFNTHTRYPLRWTRSDRLPSSNTDSWRRGGYKKPTWSRAQHSDHVTTREYFREDIRNITNHQYVIKLENNLAFQGKTIWSQEWGIGIILTHWSKSAPEIRTR